MAIVSKMTRCAACGSTAVTYSEGTKLYHCADCGAERPDSMPAADLSAGSECLPQLVLFHQNPSVSFLV